MNEVTEAKDVECINCAYMFRSQRLGRHDPICTHPKMRAEGYRVIDKDVDGWCPLVDRVPPEKAAHQFKAGDTGLCRDGVTKYEVLKEFNCGFLAVILTDCFRVERLETYINVVGRVSTEKPHGLDLMPPKQTVEFWVNVYHDREHIWTSRDAADNLAQFDRIACLHIVREFEPGEGL